MLRHKHPDNSSARLKDLYTFLLRDFVPILGYPASLGRFPENEPGKKSIWRSDGSLEIRLPGVGQSLGAFCLTLPADAADDQLCRSLCGEFVRLCKNAIRKPSQWDVKANLIKNGDFAWDDLIISLGLSGNQKYECMDILSAVRESLLFEYEKTPVQIGVIVTWNLHNTRKIFKENNCTLLQFDDYFDLRDALKSKKFLNRISAVPSSIILVSADALASHLILIPSSLPYNPAPGWELVPKNIQRLRQFLVGRDVLIAGSHTKELFFATRNYAFRWGHKNWGRLSGQQISNKLVNFAEIEVAKKLSEIIIAMAQAKIGALFVVTQNATSLLEGAKAGISRQFRSKVLFNILNVDAWATIRFAAIDGATILTKSGEIIEAGSILAVPTSSDSAAEGARTVAAVQASKYGVAIKVSSDGPISIYADGQLIRTS